MLISQERIDALVLSRECGNLHYFRDALKKLSREDRAILIRCSSLSVEDKLEVALMVVEGL